MNAGDQLTIDGRTAEVIEVRKTAPRYALNEG